MKTAILCALAVSAGVAGCGTMENLRSGDVGPRVYGGVSTDVRACQDILDEKQPDGLHPAAVPLFAHSKMVRFCLRTIDVPVSFLGDTLTLPVVFFSEPAPGAVNKDAPVESSDD